jgi:hypothetical protein
MGLSLIISRSVVFKSASIVEKDKNNSLPELETFIVFIYYNNVFRASDFTASNDSNKNANAQVSYRTIGFQEHGIPRFLENRLTKVVSL